MKHKLIILIFCGVLIAVLVNLPVSATRRINTLLRDAVTSITLFFTDITSLVHTQLQDPIDVMDEYARMTVAIEQLRYKLRQRKSLEQENRELRELLGLAARSKYRLIASRIITRDINGWWQLARLNKGSKHGITPDMAVTASNGLVGRITEVSNETSDVLFLIDPSYKISARLSRLNTFGIIRGQGVSPLGDAHCQMHFITKEVDVMPGDEVVTSGLGSIYHPGIIIGYVKHAYMDQSGLYQCADITPAVDFRSLNIVFIVVRESARESALRKL